MSVPQAKKQTMQLVLTLVITCVVAGGLLAAVYGWMGPKIEARRMEAVRSVGLEGIFPDATSFEELELAELPAGVEEPILEVKDRSGNVLGIWFAGSNRGFGGPVRMAIGVNPENASLVGVRVLEHQETPGLGSPIEELSFLEQLEGKDLGDAFKIGSDVSGLTGATVSSRAVFDGASRMAREVLAGLGVEVEVEAVPVAAEPVAPAGPAYADKIQAIVGDDVALDPADLWEVRLDNELVGVATVVIVPGFAGPIELLAVVNPETASVVGVKVLHEGETPGLGSEITQPYFLNQFVGKSGGDPFQVGQDVDGLTMATISAQAVSDATKQAIDIITQLYAGS